jgi:S1-C subfamily serine protease
MAAITLCASLAVASGSQPSKDTQRLVDEATIILTPGRCAGVIVGDTGHAITAAHCIGTSKNVDIELHDGSQSIARVEVLDRQRDVALLTLTEPNQVTPLQVAREMPRLGEALYFGGRRDREGSAQVFAVTRVGRCPSLPEVGDAIFTNLRARKGDSGAPLVNKSLEVVGLVHGGARCNIAAPIIGLGEELGLAKPSDGRDCRWGNC